ncbi:MAG: nicotinate-nucleotide adenylyltransferase [Planctomycetota bacterium]
MGRIGFFGGSFNPVHVAHLIVAERVREERRLDTALFVPAGQPPHKPARPIAPDEDRLRMLRAAVDGHPDFRVDDIELTDEGLSYTLRTVRRLRERLGSDDTLFLIMGGDSVCDLPNWWHAGQLVREVSVIAVERPGYRIEEHSDALVDRFGESWLEEMLELKVDAPLVQISATEIRRRVRDGRSIRYMVPEPVRRHILDRGLYRAAPAGT